MKKSIPPNLEDEILKKIGENWSPQKIADWLGTEHQVETSRAAVQRLVQRRAKERAPITQAVVQEQLAPKVTADLDAVDQLMAAEVHIQARVGDLDKQIAKLESWMSADIGKLYGKDGQMLPLSELPDEIRLSIREVETEQLFDGTGESKYRSGDVVKVKLHDPMRAVELLARIRREAAEHHAKLLQLRLKLAGAGSSDEADAARARLLDKIKAGEDNEE